MIFKQHQARFILLVALCFIPLISMLAGCTIDTTGVVPPPATGNSTPKGPGSANLTATAQSTPIVSICPNMSIVAASSTGWSAYKDSQFPFQFSVPPGWRAGSYNDGSDYIAQVFPPGSTTPFGIATGDPEHFQVSILLSGSTFDPGSDPANWRADATKISIGGTRTTLYERTSPTCEEINRVAVADFGQHHFTFFMTTIPAKAKNDIALFLGLIESFMYKG